MLKNKEIAKMLNISPTAVSLALNNKAGVSEETRQRVIALRNGSMAADYNEMMQSNINAPQLLLLVIKKHGDVISETPFFMSLSETLHQQSAMEGFGLQAYYTKPHEDLQKCLYSINFARYEGILVLATEADQKDIEIIRRLGKPVLIIDSWVSGLDVDCVLMDNEQGVRQAVRYALSQGHRNIGYVGSYVHANNFSDRLFAYRGEIASLGLAYNPDVVYSIHSSLDGASRDMCKILEGKPELPSVLICVNDMVAMGVMDALTKFGYAIPGDISIIGFDNMTVSSHLNPPLTTVGFESRKIAKVSVSMLIKRIKEPKDSGFMRCLIGTQLHVRDSVSHLNATT